jgi:hypothetical protein
MKYLSLATCFCFSAMLALSSCGKKADDTPGADSTKKADSSKTTSSAATAPAPANAAKYPVKSGIIHGETEAMGMKTNVTKYFDDYGAVEADESMSTIKMAGITVNTHNIKISKNGMMYDIDLEKKEGKQMKMAAPAGFGGMDFKNMGEQMMKNAGMKALANESIAGKDCKVYEMSGQGTNGMKGKIWLWGSAPLKMDMEMRGMKMKQNTIKLEENAAIPSGTFDVPKGVAMKEYDMTTGKTTDVK